MEINKTRGQQLEQRTDYAAVVPATNQAIMSCYSILSVIQYFHKNNTSRKNSVVGSANNSKVIAGERNKTYGRPKSRTYDLKNFIFRE